MVPILNLNLNLTLNLNLNLNLVLSSPLYALPSTISLRFL